MHGSAHTGRSLAISIAAVRPARAAIRRMREIPAWSNSRRAGQVNFRCACTKAVFQRNAKVESLIAVANHSRRLVTVANLLLL